MTAGENQAVDSGDTKPDNTGCGGCLSAIVAVVLFVFFVGFGIAFFTGADEGIPAGAVLTPQVISNLSESIADVTVFERVDSTNAVEITLNQDPGWGGSVEWISVAIDVFELSKEVLEFSAVSHLTFIVQSPENNSLKWARIDISRDSLPPSWREATYHRFFSFTNAAAATLQTGKWLCAYYHEYSSARPGGIYPLNCRVYTFD